MNLKFAERVDPLFDFVLQVVERAEAGEDPDLKVVRDEILKRLQHADSVFENSEKWGHTWQLARYAIVAWIDEVLVDGCAWDAADEWSRQLLQVQLNATDPEHAGSEFFNRAQEAAQQNQLDALEVYYLAVILGFRGQFRQLSESHDQQRLSPQLKEWLTATFELCTKSQQPAQLSYPSVPSTGAEPLFGRQQLQNAVTALIWLMAATILTLGLNLAVPPNQNVFEWIKQHWLTTGTAIAMTLGFAFAVRTLIHRRSQRLPNRFPDIVTAFHAGLRELKHLGLASPDIPVFLIVGTPDVSTARAVIESSELDFKLQGLPANESPLLWFASAQAIFVACPGAGEVSALGSLTSDPASHDQSMKAADTAAAIDRTEASVRLQAVCKLLREFRQPNCGINGILSFLPLHLVTGRSETAAAVQRALATDMRTLAETLQQRAHTVVVTGNLQQHPGFLKLCQRFGPEICSRNRVGKGAPGAWCEPNPETMDALTQAACQAITDNVFQLFRRDHNLETIGNSHLYRLVCSSRHKLSPQLSDVVRDAYAGSLPHGHFSLPVIGCYFAATGQHTDERAFAASVFQKLMQCSKLVDWHPDALQTDGEHRRLSRLIQLASVSLVLILGLILFLFSTS